MAAKKIINGEAVLPETDILQPAALVLLALSNIQIFQLEISTALTCTQKCQTSESENCFDHKNENILPDLRRKQQSQWTFLKVA